MKLKKLLLSLSLAGICFSQASAQSIPHQQVGSSSSARHIGDGVRSIGDTNRYVANTPDTRPEEFIPEDDVMPVSQASHMDMKILAPTACDGATSCYSSCGTGSTNRWFSSESLLWFSQNHRTPALVTRSGAGVLPLDPTYTVFGGGDGIDTGLVPGFRIGGGMYLGDCQKVGIGGRVFGIFSDTEEYNASSFGIGGDSIGIPFFNAEPLVLAEDAYLVAFTNGTPELVSEGSVAARVDLDMITADGSFHILLGRSRDHRIDLLAGYTYSRLESSVSVATESTNRFTGDLITDGTVFNTSDVFETENIFNGGHLGILSSVVRNRVSLTTLAKISFGNMRQTSDIRGYTIETLGAVSTPSAGGIFTQTSNIGTTSRDVFAFIPEIGLKLGYNVRENVQLTVGYSFIFWSSVGMAGEQMDRTIDLTQSVARPASTFTESSFWMQGIDLGVNFRF